MPVTRGQSRASSGGPSAPSTPSASATATATALLSPPASTSGLPARRSTRSVSRTPLHQHPGPHAHQSADELAVLEADAILHPSPSGGAGAASSQAAASAGETPTRAAGGRKRGSGRASLGPSSREPNEPLGTFVVRTPRLREVESRQLDPKEGETPGGTYVAVPEYDSSSQSTVASSAQVEGMLRSPVSASSVGHNVHGEDEDVLADADEEEETVRADSPSDALVGGPAKSAGSDEDADSSSASSESDESDSGSDSESEGDSDDTADTSDDGDSDSDDEDLDRLLAAAKLSAQRAASAAAPTVGLEDAGPSGSGEEMVLQLESTREVRDGPLPEMTIPAHAPPVRYGGGAAGPSRPKADSKGKGKASDVSVSSRQTGALLHVPEGLEMDDRAYERKMSKREKAAPKKATTSELWATIPTPRADLQAEMRRDYQALALANSLDPKRFMKGSGRGNKVPESFAIGTVVDQPRHLQATTVAREHRYRPGQLVQGVASDEGVGSYAKRKFGDLQSKRMENGRGKGWKKRTKW